MTSSQVKITGLRPEIRSIQAARRAERG